MPFSSAAPPTRISSTTPLASSTSPTLPLLLTRPLHTEHRWQPRKNNMSVSLHSLADAALADASERPSGHSRSRSSFALPPIAALLNPITDSQSRVARSRPQTPTQQPLVKGWSPTTPSSQPRPSQAPAEQPVQAAPIQVPVEQAQVSFEYNVRRYKRGERPSQPPAQTTRRHTAPVVPTTATCRTDVSCNDTAQNRGPSSAKGKEYHPLQGVQLDKHHPELSIHGWHEDARRLLQPPRAFSPSYPQRGPSENAVQRSVSQGPYPSTPVESGVQVHVQHPRPCWPEPLPQLPYTYVPYHPYQQMPHHVPIIAEPQPRHRQRSYRFISQNEELANAARAGHLQASASQSCFGIEGPAKRQDQRKKVSASAPVSPRSKERPPLATAASSVPITPVSSHEQRSNRWTRHASPRNSYPIRPVSPAQSTLSNASTILPIDGEPGLDMSSATSSSGSEPFDGTDMDHEESDSDDDSDARDMGGKRKRALQKMTSPTDSTFSSPAKRLLDSSQQGSTPTSSTFQDCSPESLAKRQRTSRTGHLYGGAMGTDGKPVKRSQGRNKEKRREQNAVAQKKFRWKKKQLTEKMATDLESANATIKDLEQRLEDSQGLVNKLQSELHVSQKTAEGCA
ncbi:hypothetical protein L202_02466 [Cryptococcus amylolentus CBS 6039]|uniref:BZIP domain-containing protein n=2 Tax=Cryptococcus amylolentus TaxID=104669 RepID=A0A1E3I0P7_9TREE|nr:hypothetical protein L202_02466 [Cryptococcus amylolentus CBS 6039]ODN82174.1 hypothetical protein L202_02466 [Cryptococcus amylolentus CBS 6039]ODO09735.1 hypothetical protein I350_01951 [Cryptococcus amylolentus CBS 6273]